MPWNPKNRSLAFAKSGPFGGVMVFSGHQLTTLPSWATFEAHVEALLFTLDDAACRSACKSRLELIQERSKMITLLNRELEAESSKESKTTAGDAALAAGGNGEDPQRMAIEGGVFASVMRVDNSVRLHRSWNFRARRRDRSGCCSAGRAATHVEHHDG